MLIFNSGLVVTQSPHCNSAFPHAETLGSDGRIRQEDNHDDTPGRAKGTTVAVSIDLSGHDGLLLLHHQELVFPRWQRSTNVTDTIPEKSTKGNAESVGRIPQTDPDWLFASRVPHTSDQHERRVSARLGSTAEDAEHGQGGEAIASRLKHQEDAPVT